MRAERKTDSRRGTTVVRALEDAAVPCHERWLDRSRYCWAGEAKLFITPGFSFRIVDELLTNFHLPRSTLLGAGLCIRGKEHVMRAYCHAVEAKYRFYSYGDCMLIRDPAARQKRETLSEAPDQTATLPNEH